MLDLATGPEVRGKKWFQVQQNSCYLKPALPSTLPWRRCVALEELWPEATLLWDLSSRIWLQGEAISWPVHFQEAWWAPALSYGAPVATLWLWQPAVFPSRAAGNQQQRQQPRENKKQARGRYHQRRESPPTYNCQGRMYKLDDSVIQQHISVNAMRHPWNCLGIALESCRKEKGS